jgi:hypothetical protein
MCGLAVLKKSIPEVIRKEIFFRRDYRIEVAFVGPDSSGGSYEEILSKFHVRLGDLQRA